MSWTANADGSYTYGLAEFAISFLRPRLASGGVHSGTWADVSVTYQGKLVHEARYNLSSLSSRREMAKYLAGRATLPEGQDWNGVLEAACTRMCREMRKGKQAVDLSSLEDMGEPTYVLDRLVLAGQVTIGFGNGESGKSLLAGTVGYAIATGSRLLGLRAVRQTVHYLDWETDQDETRRRLQRLAWGLGCQDVPPIHYIAMDRPLADDSETLRHLNEGVVIIDSLAPACGGDVMMGEGPIGFWNAIRGLHTTVFIIAQTQKNAQKHTIYGSGMFRYMARSVWEIRGAQDGDTIHVAAFHEKANMGRKFPPLAWRFDFDDAARTLVVTQERAAAVAEFSEHLPLQDQVAAVLHQPRTEADIAAELDAKEATIHRILYRYKDKRFVRQGDGRWALQSDREEDL